MDLKVIAIAWWVVLVILISGCAMAQGVPFEDGRGQAFTDHYHRSKSARQKERTDPAIDSIRLEPTAGYVRPYLPVVLPPRILKVWIPAHESERDEQVLIAGHWAFVMIEPASWFIEHEKSAGTRIPVKMESLMEKAE